MPGHFLYYDNQLHSVLQQILRNKWKNIPGSLSWEGSFIYSAVGIWNAYHKETIKNIWTDISYCKGRWEEKSEV